MKMSRILHCISTVTVMITSAYCAENSPVSVSPPTTIRVSEVCPPGTPNSSSIECVDGDRRETLQIKNETLLTNKDFQSASPCRDENGLGLNLVFTPNGKEIFGKAVERLYRKRLAFLINDKVVSAPTILLKHGTPNLILLVKFSETDTRKIASDLSGTKIDHVAASNNGFVQPPQISIPKDKTSTRGDDWDRVTNLIKEIRQPKELPKTRDELVHSLQKKIPELDLAYQSAMAKAPKDPRRWNAALFLKQLSWNRQGLGLPSSGIPIPSTEEILNAPDAPQEVKAETSYGLLMKSLPRNDNSGIETSAWISKANQYVKDYKGTPFADHVQKRIDALKTIAVLETKPIKFAALDGREVDLEKLRGKVVLIDFWATWCGPCVGEIPEVLKTYQKLHDQGFEIVGISLDTDRAKLDSFLKDKGMTWPQYFDGKGWQNDISSKFGINSIPTMWLVNKQGMLISTDARGDLENQVTKLLTEQPPKKP